MKKIIRKFWGVAFIVVLLSTLLVGAVPQASAGILAYTWTPLPTDFFGGITSLFPGTQITDFAVAGDGKTIYAATTWGGYKSVDAGRSFFALAGLRLGTASQVAVAPDKPNLVAYLDAGAQNVSVSLDGGATFTNLGRVQNAAAAPSATTNDIDVSKTNAGINYIGIAGSIAGAAGFFYYNLGGVSTGWRNAVTDLPIQGQNYTAATCLRFNAVQFSPSFDSDYIAYLVGSNNSNATVHVVSFNQFRFDNGVSGFNNYDQAAGGVGGTPLGNTNATTGVITPAVLTAPVRAQIAFASDYTGLVEENRLAYVSVACAATGGIWRLSDNGAAVVDGVAPFTLPAVGFWSIALKADGSTLVAAASATNRVWTIASPSSPIFAAATVNRVVKRIGVSTGTDNQTIAYNGADVLLAKSNTQGAFARSTDNGFTFNDISLVNTTVPTIVETVVKDDGVSRYVISNDGAYTSVFNYDGQYWERVLTLGGPNGAIPSAGGGALGSFGYIAKAAPADFDTLYIGDPVNADVYYTGSAGKVNWQKRTSPIPGSAMIDLEVQDETTLYAATNVAGFGGLVSKLTVTGQIWSPPSLADATATFWNAANMGSITLVSPENLLACSINGLVAFSTTGSASWIPVSLAAIEAGAGRTFATATSLAPGSIIYAAQAASAAVYAWTIFSSTTWGLAIFTGPATSLTQDLDLYNGALYRIGTNGTDMTLSRAFLTAATLPAAAGWTSTNISPQAAIYGPSFPSTANPNVVPDVLKFSTGNQIWFIDSLGADRSGFGAPPVDQIITYTDTLVASTPSLTALANGAVIPVNRETGVAYQETLSWQPASLASAYQLQIAYDSAFTRLVGGFAPLAVVFPAVIPGLPVNVVIGPPAFNYQPGEIYYWRVRASAPYFSPWSETFSFSVMPIPSPVPELYEPDNSAVVETLLPGFSWSPMAVSDTYRFELATDPDFPSGSMVYTVDTTSTGVQLTDELTDGTQYFWRVKVLTNINDGWSTVANFRVVIPVPQYTFTDNNPTYNLEPTPSETVNPSYIWAIIIIGAVLVIAIIVLIVRTRKVG